jgi:hypothetical protein
MEKSLHYLMRHISDVEPAEGRTRYAQTRTKKTCKFHLYIVQMNVRDEKFANLHICDPHVPLSFLPRHPRILIAANCDYKTHFSKDIFLHGWLAGWREIQTQTPPQISPPSPAVT